MAGKTGKGKSTRSAQKPGSRGKPITGQEKAGCIFGTGRIQRYLRQGRYCDRIGKGAAVFMAATLDYLCSEILEIAGNIAEQHKKTRITPRHIQLGVRNDEELAKLMANIQISDGGQISNINEFLFPKKSKKQQET